jgi:hypothetical protein
MKVSTVDQVPHQPLRPFLDYWHGLRGERPWPSRQEVTLEVLRSAAANTLFCRVDQPYSNLDSLRLVNVGSNIERATGKDLTGLTVGQLLRGFGGSPEFEFCFGEYGAAATEGCCTYNQGSFPWPNQEWLDYRRLVMPLGGGERPDGLFVVIDLNAPGLGLSLPPSLEAFGGAREMATGPWEISRD